MRGMFFRCVKTMQSVAAVFVLGAVFCCGVCRADGAAGGAGKVIVLKFLTYNIAGLPDYITKDRNLILPAAKRFEIIAEKIKGYDVIGMQEMFIPDRVIIERKLKTHFLAQGTTSRMPAVTGSGIDVFSTGMIQKSIFERWRKQYEVDRWSHKGFVGAETQLEQGITLHVYSLHAQAGAGKKRGPEARIDNYMQLLDAVKRFSKGTGYPIIIMGDFNCEPGEEECRWLMENSGLKEVSMPAPDQIDHIFYDENESGWKISVDSSRFVFMETVGGRRLSDHLGVEAVMRFER